MIVPLEYILVTILQMLVMCMAVVITWRAVKLSRKALEQAEDIRRIADLQRAMIKVLMDGDASKEGR